jgi:hypothetical protein
MKNTINTLAKALQFLIGFDFTSILVSLNVADRDTFYKAPPLVANFHVEQCGRYRVS